MGGLGSVLGALFCKSGTSEPGSFSCRALMPQGHVWKIVGNSPSPGSSNWVALGWVSLETNARSQRALSSGMP